MARFQLREIAEPERWTIRKLAQATGLARNTVANVWNNKTRYVNLDTLEALATVLGVSVRDLLVENGNDDQGNHPPVLLAA